MQTTRNSQMPIKIIVLANSDLFVDGLLRILNDNEHVDIIDSISNLETCLHLIANSQADILMIQEQLIETPYEFFFKKLKKINLQLKTLVFGQLLETDFLINIIRSGANGYINSNMSSEHLIKAVQHVHQGRLWAERSVLEQLAQDALQMENILENIAMEKTRMLSDILTKREAQVFQWVLKGLSTKEIAEQIFLSEQSVKLHLSKLFKKFEVTNRPQLLLSAFEKVSPVSNIIPLIQMTLEKKAPGQKKSPPVNHET